MGAGGGFSLANPNPCRPRRKGKENFGLSRDNVSISIKIIASPILH
jgi:hypothetical protein